LLRALKNQTEKWPKAGKAENCCMLLGRKLYARCDR